MDRFTRNSYPGILCAVVILLLTGFPGSSFPHVKPVVGLDKVIHFLMYAGFTYLTLWGYRKPYAERGKAYRLKAMGLTLAVGALLGAATEAIQAIPVLKRSCSIYDWIADLIGCIVGVGIYYFFHRRRK